MTAAPAFHIHGARVLRPGGWDDGPIGVEDGLLTEGRPGRALDLSGYWLLPGIVDPHGDGFERHLAPRRGALRDLGDGLAMAEAELAVNGITTGVLAQFFSWEGGMRSPDFATRLVEAHGQMRPTLDLRLQLRLETHLLADFDRAARLVEDHAIPYLVFNDHIPHAALEKGRKPPRLTGQALKSGRSPEAHLALLQDLHARSPEVPNAIAALVERLAPRGTRFGSHDDASAADRRHWRALGAKIAEFPETADAAAEAAAAGEPIVLGAPNVVRGSSHAGKVSARDLVAAGHCTALASDYHYPAPRQAALALAEEIGIAPAWALVSSGPAQLLGLTDRGQLAPGLRADMIALDPATGRVAATFAAGRPAWLSPQIATRLL
ncbi:alpha-D-ribose 1-methylphosphonate 5-triphosphate diphosphatase [Pseudooceanicola sp. HF7]|uniref:alpha-D-ribose 1-methylphosphonate 5-triphosphate diphosphatase n=1 Tax=Pseudooceanicola sp. HF7 TaxID=2721560 RepID=UPI0014320632|nr:alpha-D-ribose 1-methylphosphonate 5-triphosphate diphosphatase [Pseudooceanicola sp. HF7]NIZ08545.1 alpha-D-ribose 1-methylphosphonate 5-triphosphate diphosphatase [Pseudooceanicola sp. HF7]